MENIDNELRLDKKYIQNNFGYSLEEELKEPTKDNIVLNIVYRYLLTYIMSINSNFRGNMQELKQYLLSKEEYVNAFKWAQFKQLYNMIEYDTDDVLKDVKDIIVYELKLLDLNGWQKAYGGSK